MSSNITNTRPRHLRNPGEEGYRTPTIDDYEREIGKGKDEEAGGGAFPFSRPPKKRKTLTSNNSCIRTPSQADSTPIKLDPAANGQPPESKPVSPAENGSKENYLPWRERLKHFTWSFFTITMATGGIANVLYAVPYRFHGLTIIGDFFFLLNIVLYIANWILISLRFYFHPHTFKASFLHPTESLFVPAAAVSFGTILINISQYGLQHVGPWLNKVVQVLFWFDATLAVVLSVTIYLLLWSTQYFSVSRMTPIWIFPAYPLLIIGPHAGILSTHLSPARALPIIIGGFTIQGVGFLVSLMVYSAFIYRLMTQKLPRESLRPGMFVSVGPAGFTVAGIVNMAANAERVIPAYFMDGDNGHMVALIVKVCAQWMALWLWGLAIWFFLVSVGAHLTAFVPHAVTYDGEFSDFENMNRHGDNGRDDSKFDPSGKHSPFHPRLKKPELAFNMTFFSFVFPNTALVTATFAIGAAFDTRAIKVLGCVMTCLLILTWIAVVVGMVRAIRGHVILWPELGEDRDEGGFKMKDRESGRSTRELVRDVEKDVLEGGGIRRRPRTLSNLSLRRGGRGLHSKVERKTSQQREHKGDDNV